MFYRRLNINLIYHRFRNLILYGLIGASCAGLDFVVYTLLCLVIPYLYANVISIHVGIFCSFLLNRQYNFRMKDKTMTRFLSFYVVGLTGLFISEGMLLLLVQAIGISKITSKLVSVVVVALIQYVLNKYVSFRDIQKNYVENK